MNLGYLHTIIIILILISHLNCPLVRFFYLFCSFSSPPKAATVLIDDKTSSAMAPALAYASNSLLVKTEMT
jgi:hypothetical protein